VAGAAGMSDSDGDRDKAGETFCDFGIGPWSISLEEPAGLALPEGVDPVSLAGGRGRGDRPLESTIGEALRGVAGITSTDTALVGTSLMPPAAADETRAGGGKGCDARGGRGGGARPVSLCVEGPGAAFPGAALS
jgi:hypothetical protein